MPCAASAPRTVPAGHETQALASILPKNDVAAVEIANIRGKNLALFRQRTAEQQQPTHRDPDADRPPRNSHPPRWSRSDARQRKKSPASPTLPPAIRRTICPVGQR
jgi:hypothetical protein